MCGGRSPPQHTCLRPPARYDLIIDTAALLTNCICAFVLAVDAAVERTAHCHPSLFGSMSVGVCAYRVGHGRPLLLRSG